jgi:hypothetical protein
MNLKLVCAAALASVLFGTGAHADGTTEQCKAGSCAVQCASEVWLVPTGATYRYENVVGDHMRLVLSKATLKQSTNYFMEFAIPHDQQVEIYLKPDQQCAVYGFS